MTAIETLKFVFENSLGIKVKFIEANLFRANVVVDQMKEETDFPVFILIPVRDTESERVNKAMVSRKMPVVGYLLYRNEDQSTSDFDFDAVRPLVEQAKYLCDKATAKLYDQPITDKEKDGIKKYVTTETYAKLDAHLFGCQLRFDWDLIEHVPC